MEKDINILAIESSCDETAAAVVRNGRQGLSGQRKCFERAHCRCNTAFMQKEQLQARLWMYLDLETLIKVFSSV